MTLKAQVADLKERLEKVKSVGRNYVIDLKHRKQTQAYHYIIAHKPVALSGNAVGPNLSDLTKTLVIPVMELAGHVQTADKLGFDTRLTVSDNKLLVTFVEKTPEAPNEFYTL